MCAWLMLVLPQGPLVSSVGQQVLYPLWCLRPLDRLGSFTVRRVWWICWQTVWCVWPVIVILGSIVRRGNVIVSVIPRRLFCTHR